MFKTLHKIKKIRRQKQELETIRCKNEVYRLEQERDRQEDEMRNFENHMRQSEEAILKGLMQCTIGKKDMDHACTDLSRLRMQMEDLRSRFCKAEEALHQSMGMLAAAETECRRQFVNEEKTSELLKLENSREALHHERRDSSAQEEFQPRRPSQFGDFARFYPNSPTSRIVSERDNRLK
ncbi:MAG: YscO family type III secretion system apparatus protein [Parvibaculaceae bacterium]|nr:YscO family type III secretion system apparatus protein [Parvibaculaceae bacterium]